MKDKTRSTFTFQIAADVRAALDKMAAEKEWTTGHLVGSILAAHVASVGKPAKIKASKKAKPAAVAAPAVPVADVLRHSADLDEPTSADDDPLSF